MKHLVCFLLFVLAHTLVLGQNTRKQVQRLQAENDSLRLELKRCQDGPMQRLAQTMESPKFGENPQYSRKELHAKLLPQIKAKSDEKYGKALNIIISTDLFLQYCDSIKANLIRRTGGLDAKGQPVGARDNKTPTQFFIEEKRGADLKSKIEAQRAVYLNLVQESPYFIPRIVLQVESMPENTRASSWEEFKFKSMPLAAIMPMIGKFQSDAIASEVAVLQFLNE